MKEMYQDRNLFGSEVPASKRKTWFPASAGKAGIIFRPRRTDRKFQPQKKYEDLISQSKIYYVTVPASRKAAYLWSGPSGCS